MNDLAPSSPGGTHPASPTTAHLPQESGGGEAKQQRDVAFAAVLLRTGRVTERALAQAVADWSAYGSSSLADHLAERGLVSSGERSDLERLADHSSWDADGAAGDESPDVLATSAWEVPDGEQERVARILGLGQAMEKNTEGGNRALHARYTILRKLGQGGLGTVWLARDETLRRRVAIKELTGRPDPTGHAEARFRREAEVTGQLEHPNIVSVYQFGKDPGTGSAFTVMRFVGKKTLADAIAEYHERLALGMAKMELHRLLSAFLSVCQAIGFAHSRGVIHRDLKPENVALDSYGQVIVLDWGLAKTTEEAEGACAALTGAEASEAVEATVAGQVLGTPLYMAPEQATGRVDEIDERTDVYGLGATLFAILTGYAPHEQSHASLSGRNQVNELFTAIAKEPTPRARSLNPGVDPALEAVCAKAMAKKRFARYESASQLADDVQRWIAGEPVSAYEEPVSARARRWVGRHQRLSQVLAFVILALLALGATLGFLARQRYLVERDAQFDEMRSEAREFEVGLRSAARDLGKDARFMSNLPPIQAIIDARADPQAGEGEEVWCARLEKIYEGLLRANPDYLAVAYLGVSPDGTAREIVRIERLSTEDAQVQIVPKSRRAEVLKQGAIEETLQLQPGETRFCTEPIRTTRSAGRRAGGRRLLATVPVYSTKTGEPFGVVAIEMALAEVVQHMLQRLRSRLPDVYVTEATGAVWMRKLRAQAVEKDPEGTPVTALVPGTEGFFVPGQPAHVLTEQGKWVAIKVFLDPDDPEDVVGLVLRLDGE